MIRLLMAQSTGTISVISNMWAAVPPPAEHGFAYDLWVGILANFLTAALVIGFWALWELAAKRRRLFRFFGLAHEKTLRIFIGQVPHQGAPQGLVGFQESSEALRLAELFKSPIPGLSDRTLMSRNSRAFASVSS